MLTRPSFKKSLIVEQFQRNYLKVKRFELAFERMKCISYFNIFRSTIPYYRNSIEKVISEKGSMSVIGFKAMSSICTTHVSLNKREIVIKFKGKVNQII